MPIDILIAWLTEHPRSGVWIAALCLWISVSLIIRMWFLHRDVSALRKMVWSLILLVPLLGWLFYAGGFRIPEVTDIPIPPSAGTMGSGN